MEEKTPYIYGELYSHLTNDNNIEFNINETNFIKNLTTYYKGTLKFTTSNTMKTTDFNMKSNELKSKLNYDWLCGFINNPHSNRYKIELSNPNINSQLCQFTISTIDIELLNDIKTYIDISSFIKKIKTNDDILHILTIKDADCIEFLTRIYHDNTMNYTDHYLYPTYTKWLTCISKNMNFTSSLLHKIESLYNKFDPIGMLIKTPSPFIKLNNLTTYHVKWFDLHDTLYILLITDDIFYYGIYNCDDIDKLRIQHFPMIQMKSIEIIKVLHQLIYKDNDTNTLYNSYQATISQEEQDVYLNILMYKEHINVSFTFPLMSIKQDNRLLIQQLIMLQYLLYQKNNVNNSKYIEYNMFHSYNTSHIKQVSNSFIQHMSIVPASYKLPLTRTYKALYPDLYTMEEQDFFYNLIHKITIEKQAKDKAGYSSSSTKVTISPQKNFHQDSKNTSDDDDDDDDELDIEHEIKRKNELYQRLLIEKQQIKKQKKKRNFLGQ